MNPFDKLRTSAELAYASHDILGEGPVWSVEEQAFYWIDIKKPCIQRWNPETGAHKSWVLPAEIGSFSLREQGGAILALQNGFFFFDFDTGEVTPVTDPEADKPRTRFNDGKCDRRGRFWAGTMDNDEVDFTMGSLYRINPDLAVTHIRGGVGISNGLGWSPDNKTMYYADSPAQCIYVYDFDLETGTPTNERIFARIEKGVPDGLTVDRAGYIWNCEWDGWRVVRYAPDGSVDYILEVPVQRPTSCIFGGADLRDLYITSASINLSDAERAAQPHAGCVLRAKCVTPGLPEPRFAG